MKTRIICISFLAVMALRAQQPSVPRITSFNGAVTNAAGLPQTGTIAITFSLFEEHQGGTALWSETQNVTLDNQGHYTVLLGTTHPDGLPLEVFSSGKARWLAVTPLLPGMPEQPRILLVGVPYAMKAADADTLGGLPASAFLQAASVATQPVANSVRRDDSPADITSGAACGSITSDGTAAANQIALFTAACNIEPSTIVEVNGNVGIGTTSPSTTFNVKGTTTLQGALKINSQGAATAKAGTNSYPAGFTAASFNSGTNASANQVFQWQAQPLNNNTATPSASMNLLFGEGTAAPANTGFSIAASGLVTFAPSQTFPGTVTGVTAGTALTGGGTSGNVTLNVDTTQVPLLNTANIFNAAQTFNGQLISTAPVGIAPFQVASATQVLNLNASLLGGLPAAGFATTGANIFSASQTIANGNLSLPATAASGSNGVILLGGTPLLHACCSGNNNIFAGGGNFSTTASNTVGVGSAALAAVTTGTTNTAVGFQALNSNTTGSGNTALGAGAGVGPSSANANVTGSNNTFIGANAAPGTTQQLTNATAIGANAVVSASNTLVLGAPGTSVGIGTPNPVATLEVNGPAQFDGIITFAPNQQFPGGSGTITGVTAGTALTGGGTSGAVTLNVDTTKVPLLSAANTFTASQTLNGQLISTVATGTAPFQVASTTLVPSLNAGLLDGFPATSFAGTGANTFTATQTIGTGDLALPATAVGGYTGVLTIGGFPFLHACCDIGVGNVFVGNSGNTVSEIGPANTGIGSTALVQIGNGAQNTAVGSGALSTTSTGSANTAVGYNAGAALQTEGDENTTGSNNTFLGANAAPTNSKLTNATAIGANAAVSASNSLVLGSINGVNGATAGTNVGIGTATPGATLEVNGTAKFDGLITFAQNQTFPGAITQITAGTDLTGGGTSGNITLNLDTTKVPQLGTANTYSGNQTTSGQWISTVATGAAPLVVSSTTQVANLNASLLGGIAPSGFATTGANSFSGTQTVSGNLSLPATATGGAAGVITLSGAPFLHSCCGSSSANTFVGQAGSLSTTGTGNSALGDAALGSIGNGLSNTAIGLGALSSNTSGSGNTAVGVSAGSGLKNTPNINGSNNTFVGALAAPGTTTQLTNATAIGASAVVSESNALVLGSINGINGATANTYVGIGTATPSAPLQVNGSVVISGSGNTLTFPDGSVQSTAAGSSTPATYVNPLQVALLKWFPAYQSATYAVGGQPRAVAFDGANIWVANYASNNVMEIQANNGNILGTYSVNTPSALAFDGVNMWVANNGEKTITKLQASTGKNLGTVAVGTEPSSLAFDGTNIWVGNYGSNNVTVVLASTSTVVNTYQPVASGNTTAVVFDGAYIWVANTGNLLSKLQTATGAALNQVTLGSSPEALAFDGTNIWVTTPSSGDVVKVQAASATVVSTISVGGDPFGLAFDGTNMWVSGAGAGGGVAKVQAATGALLGVFSAGMGPQAMAFDGANIWVANLNSNSLSKL